MTGTDFGFWDAHDFAEATDRQCGRTDFGDGPVDWTLGIIEEEECGNDTIYYVVYQGTDCNEVLGWMTSRHQAEKMVAETAADFWKM